MRNLPDWHEKPLTLTKEEILNPEAVLSEFLHSYPLADLREYLRSLLLMACNDEDCNAPFNIILCEDIIRLAESCSILNKKEYGENNV